MMKLSILAAAGLFASAVTAQSATVSFYGEDQCSTNPVSTDSIALDGDCHTINMVLADGAKITNCPVVECNCVLFQSGDCSGAAETVNAQSFGANCANLDNDFIFFSAICVAIGHGIGQ